jgi:ribosomal protein S18 acetylase RimI-like enzyme
LSAAAPTFRIAGAADVARIARLHAESWRVAYRGILTDTFLDGPVFGDRELLWHARINEGRDGPLRVILMEDATELVGFGSLCPEADPAFGVLLDNLHVRPGARGAGLGTRLLAAIADDVAAMEPGAPLHLWVLDDNRDARAFYRRRGGEEVGMEIHRMPDGGDHACHRVLWRSLRALRLA